MKYYINHKKTSCASPKGKSWEIHGSDNFCAIRSNKLRLEPQMD